MVAKRRWDGGVKACIIHDLLRDLCLEISKQQPSLNWWTVEAPPRNPKVGSFEEDCYSSHTNNLEVLSNVSILKLEDEEMSNLSDGDGDIGLRIMNEILRLRDRLQYYETVNHEMSQRKLAGRHLPARYASWFAGRTEKMSKSEHHPPFTWRTQRYYLADVNLKIKKAFCPPKVVEKNPCLEYIKYIIFPWFNEFTVEQKPENVGYAIYVSVGYSLVLSLGGCNRCQMINPTFTAGTVQRSNEPLATLASYRRLKRKVYFGIFLKLCDSIEQDAWLRVGQEIVALNLEGISSRTLGLLLWLQLYDLIKHKVQGD
ncbi:hypothetical protein DH2020_001954 [Rehmannia glutinosa]|uniref:tyrosine--tRNA ligase n=1 Tax=Rehmannia glutinosa TaxID=99300 RepID=A0ABR0XSQ4_REHGL